MTLVLRRCTGITLLQHDKRLAAVVLLPFVVMTGKDGLPPSIAG